MSLANFKPVAIDSFGSLLSRVRAEAIPLANAVAARNIRFKPKAIITRPGLSQTATLPDRTLVPRGAIVLSKKNTQTGNVDQFPLFFGSNETRYALALESPSGSGQLHELGGNTIPGVYMDASNAYGRAFLAFGDLKKGVVSPSQTDGVFLDRLGMAAAGSTCTLLASPDTGNVESGTRYAVVLFMNRYGAISGVSSSFIASVTLDDDTHKIRVTNIPVSTEVNTAGYITARIIAFTTAGASQDGPYFFIPSNDVVGDIQITSTVIHDNTTQQADFNFTDVYLQGTTDITSPLDYFDKIQLASQAAVYYSPTTRRLIWAGGLDDETIFRVSESDDPETYLGTTGFLKPAQNDGERAITAREFRAQLYLFKEHAGFIAYQSDIAPANWSIDKRWDRVGPVGPWAVDVSESFMVFLDRSGLYHYDGSIPVSVSDEISSTDSDLWSRINWSVREKFWVFIDTDLDEVHVGVALDGSSVPNIVLKLNYLSGFEAGRRKWSTDDIPASKILRVDRNLAASPNPQTPLPQVIATNHMLVLSANPDGMINIYDPTSHMDNGNRVDSRYQTGYYEAPGVNQIGGVGLSGRGQGEVLVRVFKDQDRVKNLVRPLVVDDAINATVIKADGQSPWWSVEYSNSNVAGDWFEITSGNLYLRQLFKTRRPRLADQNRNN